jgi:hypothetical protein
MVRKTALLLIGVLVLPAILSLSPAEARYWRSGYYGGLYPYCEDGDANRCSLRRGYGAHVRYGYHHYGHWRFF